MSYVIDDRSVWRSIHSCYIDALADQEPDVAQAVTIILDGFTFDAFERGLRNHLILATPSLTANGDPALRLEVMTPDGYLGLARIPAEVVGLDPEDLADAVEDTVTGSTERMIAELDGDV